MKQKRLASFFVISAQYPPNPVRDLQLTGLNLIFSRKSHILAAILMQFDALSSNLTIKTLYGNSGWLSGQLKLDVNAFFWQKKSPFFQNIKLCLLFKPNFAVDNISLYFFEVVSTFTFLKYHLQQPCWIFT